MHSTPQHFMHQRNTNNEFCSFLTFIITLLRLIASLDAMKKNTDYQIEAILMGGKWDKGD